MRVTKTSPMAAATTVVPAAMPSSLQGSARPSKTARPALNAWVVGSAWAIGLIFHAPSPRAVDPAVAAEIGPAFHRRAEICGVFVNAPLEDVERTADVCRLTMVQLHGDEGPEYASEIARRTGAKVMKAARVKDAASLQALNVFRRVDYQLADTTWVLGS